MDELGGLADSAGRVFLVASIVEGFLDTNLQGEWWGARALEIDDPILRASVRAWAASRGGTVDDWTTDEKHVVHLMAIEARVHATDADAALLLAQRKLSPLVRALSYRQLRPGRIVAWIAHAEDGGPTQARRSYVDLPRIYHMAADDTWTPEADVEAIAEAISASPTGDLFAGLYSEALADESPEGMVVRLWSLLEALSRDFWVPDKSKKAELRMVERAMAHLGLGEGAQLADAYHWRNVFLHQGVRGDPSQLEPIRGRLVRLAFEALGRGGFRQVDPNSPTWDPAGARPVRRVIARASEPRPQA
jgi:hypothetical protein